MKATTCRECGAPRKAGCRVRLCDACYKVYWQHHYADTRASNMAGRLAATYRRLGLRPGHVWKQVQS